MSMTVALFLLALTVCGPSTSVTQTCETVIAPGQYDLQACHNHGSFYVAAGNAHAYACRRVDGEDDG